MTSSKSAIRHREPDRARKHARDTPGPAAGGGMSADPRPEEQDTDPLPPDIAGISEQHRKMRRQDAHPARGDHGRNR